MSKWFVISSRRSKCGLSTNNIANANLAFCPPESVQIGCVAKCPESPNDPKYERPSCSLIFELLIALSNPAFLCFINFSNPLTSSCEYKSTKCWSKCPTTALE
ncbi:hypothetical protein BB559_000220 [Furculomyces boomerangus]|uniref:Uncharacterized protein n=1 Tax=Furculomyces boomerangus TaxID=61424 RepID=A0A2T9Z625_9FUNG|nr:hypothetical protein BB559_000220 [Furculomyces boomerangus]